MRNTIGDQRLDTIDSADTPLRPVTSEKITRNSLTLLGLLVSRYYVGCTTIFALYINTPSPKYNICWLQKL